MSGMKRTMKLLLLSLITAVSLSLFACSNADTNEVSENEETPAADLVVAPDVYKANIAFLKDYFDEMNFSDREGVNEGTAKRIATAIGYSKEGAITEVTSEWVGESATYLDIDITDDTGEVYMLRINKSGTFSGITDSSGEYIFMTIK